MSSVKDRIKKYLGFEKLTQYEKNYIDDTNTMAGIYKMAEQIGMHTLSEGVETGDEADFLENIGCERLQGFLIGRPMPVEELYKKIENDEYTVSKEFINA